jgi:N4-gp56 family major capsid protein
MATLSTATSGFGTLVQELVGRAAEDELRAKLVHTIPDQVLPLTQIKGTNLVRLARYADVAVQTTALTEGTPPTAQSLTIASEAFSATQIGGVFELTDLGLLDSPHDLIAVNAERAGRQAANSMDVMVRDIVAAGASVQYITGAARSSQATTSIVTGAFIKKMVALLVKNNVPRFPDGTFRCILDPFVSYDIFTDTSDGGWMDASRYANNKPLLAGELGTYHGVRFLESTNAKSFVDAGVSNADVFSSTFYGPNAWAISDSQSLSSYYVPPGGDHSDPIAQLAKIGWKVRFGCMLVDEAGPRYIRLESGATLGT